MARISSCYIFSIYISSPGARLVGGRNVIHLICVLQVYYTSTPGIAGYHQHQTQNVLIQRKSSRNSDKVEIMQQI